MPQDESMEGCTCSTKTSETHTGLILGKCNHKYNDRFYCYVDKSLLPHCCEEESQRFVNYCVNYSICGGHPDGPPVRCNTVTSFGHSAPYPRTSAAVSMPYSPR